MPAKLPKTAAQFISDAVDEVFDRLVVRALGPGVVDKQIFVAFDRKASLPGLYESAAEAEGHTPDTELLDSLLRISHGYLDATREKAKSKILQSVQAQLGNAKRVGPKKFRTALRGELEDLWDSVSSDVERVLDTEANHVKNIGVMDGIVKVNASQGVEDPVVFFVVVRDDVTCSECLRLHVCGDGHTPKLWRLSEIGSGYHKKGEPNPKIGGLHPHCRCTLTTLLPGYGFDAAGKVEYKHEGYDALKVQQGVAGVPD
jgi:hypothetical protein